MADLLNQKPMPAQEIAGRISTYRRMFPYAKEPTEREAKAIVETWWKALTPFPAPFSAEAFDWWISNQSRMPTVADIVARATHNIEAARFRIIPDKKPKTHEAPKPLTFEERQERARLIEKIKAEVAAKRT